MRLSSDFGAQMLNIKRLLRLLYVNKIRKRHFCACIAVKGTKIVKATFAHSATFAHATLIPAVVFDVIFQQFHYQRG